MRVRLPLARPTMDGYTLNGAAGSTGVTYSRSPSGLYEALSFNGRTTGSDPVNHGSIPCEASSFKDGEVDAFPTDGRVADRDAPVLHAAPMRVRISPRLPI